MARMFQTSNRLDEANRAKVVDELNLVMADTVDLRSQTKHAHWNVMGVHFFQLHELFDLIAEPLPAFVDVMAERITQLGGYATGTLRMAAAATRLPEMPEDALTGEQFLQELISRYALMSENLVEAIEKTEQEWEDPVTSDLLQEVSQHVDKSLYFLERHLMDGQERGQRETRSKK